MASSMNRQHCSVKYTVSKVNGRTCAAMRGCLVIQGLIRKVGVVNER